MKLSEHLITLLIILLCVLPFAWFMLIGKNRASKNKKAIRDLIKNDHLKMDNEEFWNQNFIGIDTVQNKLVFVTLKNEGSLIININLNDVKSCQINKISNDIKRDNKMESELQKMTLEVTFISKKPNESLVFYDLDDNLSEDFEMRRAEKWQQLIASQIKKGNQHIAA